MLFPDAVVGNTTTAVDPTRIFAKRFPLTIDKEEVARKRLDNKKNATVDRNSSQRDHSHSSKRKQKKEGNTSETRTLNQTHSILLDADKTAKTNVLSNAVARKLLKCGNKPNSVIFAHPPPRYMSDTSNPVYFLHIGKAGGTSIDSLIPKLLKGTGKRYIGNKHYDWSYIQQQQQSKIGRQGNLRGGNSVRGGFEVSTNADIITFLRHPVSRAVSQFYFGKKLSWMKKLHEKSRDQTLDEYLDDSNKTWTQPIADGESGSSFLAGIFSTKKKCWVASDNQETDLKIYLRNNKTAATLFAAGRLENTTWFGIMEDMDRSMKLLQLTLGLDVTPVLPKSNSKRGGNPKPSNATVRKIKQYVPKDLWLYEYAKRLFEARWEYFAGNCTYIPPELPPLPDFK